MEEATKDVVQIEVKNELIEEVKEEDQNESVKLEPFEKLKPLWTSEELISELKEECQTKNNILGDLVYTELLMPSNQIPSSSEDELDSDDASNNSEDDSDYACNDSKDDSDYAFNDSEDDSDFAFNDSEDELELDTETDGEVPCVASEVITERVSSRPNVLRTNRNNQKPSPLFWEKKNLMKSEEETEFKGTEKLTGDILRLETPFQFFMHLFHENIFEKMVTESILYSVQMDPGRPFDFTLTEAKQYIGILVFMSVVPYPNIRAYWNESIGFDKIKVTMSSKRFAMISKFCHFNDNQKDDKTDRLYKIRPVYEMLRERLRLIPLESCLFVDEQIFTSKTHHIFKQYMPNKSHKWRFKLFVLSGASGFSYNFEVYTGLENGPEKRRANEPDLGASANVVIRLMRTVPDQLNYRLFFNSYFTSISLITHLAKKGILSLGPARRHRIPNCKLPTEDQLRKVKRGWSIEHVAKVNDVDISAVLWKDAKSIIFLSNLAGEQPVNTAIKYDSKLKKKITVPCPNVVREYNKHMGGVEMLDSLIGRCKIKVGSNKWYFRLFYHFIDMTLVNAWTLYKRALTQKENHSKPINLYQFRIEVAECLTRVGIVNRKTRDRTSDQLEPLIQAKKRKYPRVVGPPEEVRLDTVQHLPVWRKKRNRCRNPICNKASFIYCRKCDVPLCLNRERNCFELFHLA